MGDYRTRNDRVQRQVEAWQEQLLILVDAYLTWKHGPSIQTTSTSTSNVLWPLKTLTMTGMFHMVYVAMF